MADHLRNDEKTQVFYNSAMLRDPNKRTILLGVVKSESFANTDLDYYVGIGGLAGVMGLPFGSDMGSVANDKWLNLNEGDSQEKSPMFCWIDSVKPKIEDLSKSGAWLQLDDVVGSLSSGDHNPGPLHAGIPRAGIVILLKICGALADLGYPVDVVAKVGSLVRSNLVTAVHHEELRLGVEASSLGGGHEIETGIGVLLRSLLGSMEPRTRSVNMNSNEPVLLINSFGNLYHEQLHNVVRAIAERLQQDWNIWPVRIYAGPFLVGKVDEEHGKTGFSITLLNVVNTDIGGPSMIDLLDAACDSPIWSYRLNGFFKEIWRDRKLVERYDTGISVSRSASPDSLSQQSNDSADQPGEASAAHHDEAAFNDNRAGVQVAADNGKPLLEGIGDAHEPGFSGYATNSGDDLTWDDVRATYNAQKMAELLLIPHSVTLPGGESLLDLVRSQAEGLVSAEARREDKRKNTDAPPEDRPTDNSEGTGS